MTEKATDLFGIPIPSDNRLFLVFILIHIVFALLCVISGLAAMLSEKTRKRHPIAGKTYFWSMLLVFVTTIILSIMRWPQNNHLLAVGGFAFILTYTGRRLAQARIRNWTRFHTICMGLSYVLLLTGFYVDNGKNLPFWKQFPQLVFWVFPALVGLPIIIIVLIKHPLNKANSK